MQIALCGAARAEPVDHTAEGPVLVAALAEVDYPPFYYTREGHLTGISVDVINYLADKLNLRIVYQRLSWPRVLQSLERGHVDLVTTFYYTPERARDVIYVQEPHATEVNAFFTRMDSKLTFDGDLHELEGHMIGVIRGYTYGLAFDDADFLHKDPVLDERTLVRMVVGGRFNVAIGNPFAIRLEARRQGVEDQIRLIDPPVDLSPIYMAISRQYPDARALADAFTDTIRRLKASPYYDELLRRYDLDERAEE
ncbi:substrate-binding periplasmic protein [Marinobacter halodurans]|uniref:substrate-binding periplasmic protein n=1 Tax=Marinobacter halodurans TaxID=2528979 RepID=UPI0013F15FC7|nr:transporter substrate-binding domain-containing protein [Marinobacter halodurans]